MNIIQYLGGYKNVIVLIILGVIAGIANSVRAIFMNFIAPDTIEYTRYKTGKDCSGIFYALNSFVTKAVGSVGASLGLLIMSLYHWNPVQAESFEELLAMGIQEGQAAYQSPLAIHGMWVVYALIPGIGYLLSALVMWFYKLKDRDAELRAKCNAGEITREECEARLSRKY
jgi:Na+/melibiose symporter-like transporter